MTLLGVVVYLELNVAHSLPRVLEHYLHAFGLYSFVGFLMDGPGAVAVEALGLQLVPTFDQPWLSSSLSDFWGRRWNITTSSVLRTLIYDPIVDGALINPRHRTSAGCPLTPAGSRDQRAQEPQGPVKEGRREGARREKEPPKGSKPSLWRQQLGLHATFLTSGLIHEYTAWNVSGLNKWHWKWTLFFYAQAPLMTAEWLVRKALRRAGVPGLPRWLSTIATLAVLEALAYHLFFGFVDDDCDLTSRMVNAVGANFKGALESAGPLLSMVGFGGLAAK
ncbi:hypothetical protein GPECTOR_6g568 [Gonium pectorale]|uniref:Wax synthase domain-containing protein n=1 Tax=Gonium pectorale TaxID=33097 RepID=A0A150GUZ2_GONPE|nr:hypothetical protein GPECTOR_6g568 [Gonium pectorale]|eukprot:KXZ53651.1 hypothetical protein GPECTOR_6g568 [Gonium pectorale]